ncbi:hypothetical protein H632_c5485p0, partial [Helicosporidium sp. ATCC 50920]
SGAESALAQAQGRGEAQREELLGLRERVAALEGERAQLMLEAASEDEIARLKTALEAAEKRTRELSWQVRILHEAKGDEAPKADAGSNKIVSMLDMFGCAINFDRKERRLT